MSETEQQAALPEEQPAATEAPAPQETEQQEQEQRENAVERRFSRLTARLSSISRERDELAQRMAMLEQRLTQPAQPPASPEVQAAIEAQARALAEQQRTQEKIDNFHAAGKEHFADWPERCNDLIAMGADPQFAALLVEIPDGYKVAAALRDDPAEVERIAAIRGERARMLELGKYAARLEAKPTRAVSRAPPPPRPVEGRASPQFIPQQATMEQLLEHYSKQAMERRRNGQ